MAQVTTLLAIASVGSLGALLGLSIPGAGSAVAEHRPSTTFSVCHTGGGMNCAVDGDTAWIDGIKVRVADIDAPETHPPHCPSEAALGDQATRRLAAVLSAGPFEMKAIDRDTDRYGRKLRVLVRDGHSLGDQLVREGLARIWDGARHPWC